MGFAEGKIEQVNSDSKKARSKILNQNPSQKKGKLGNTVRQGAGAVTTIGGTVSNVGHVVGKVAGALGATGLQKMLEGSRKIKWHDTYGKKSGEGGSREGALSRFDRAERSGRSLADFCQAFSSEGHDRNREIDTECTFEMRFELEPVEIQARKKLRSEEHSGNHTLMGAIFSQYMVPRVVYDKNGNPEVRKPDGGDLQEFDMGFFVQKMTLPNITLAGGESVKTLMGDFPVNGLYLQPDQHTFTLEVVNLRSPLQEDLFYMWMREVSAPFWIYEEQPYTTANITIDLLEHMDISYVFLNARPSNILTVQPSQEPQQVFTR